MKVHLKQIPGGETLRIEGEECADGLGLDEAGASPVGPLHYCLDVGISENGLFATGTLRLRVRLQCVVTLEYFEEEVRGAESFFAVLALLGKTDLLRTHEVARVRGVVRTLEEGT